jgi:hypothetical protein
MGGGEDYAPWAWCVSDAGFLPVSVVYGCAMVLRILARVQSIGFAITLSAICDAFPMVLIGKLTRAAPTPRGISTAVESVLMAAVPIFFDVSFMFAITVGDSACSCGLMRSLPAVTIELSVNPAPEEGEEEDMNVLYLCVSG